ncbi:MAG: 3-oxoacyl-ACP synthase [Desulfobulbus propionicus]|nr:MAG: 3-oxoacyl-ACP synthase [Desulfobulbus propionicus]
MNRAVVLGTGFAVPERCLTNHDLAAMVETSDEWIVARTGIRERRIAGKGEFNYQLGARAGQQALDAAGIEAAEVDVIIVATLSSHMLMPSTACFVQMELGAVNAFAFDINAACSGFLYGLDQVNRYIQSDPSLKILLIGSETMSARVNWEDRNTCVLFGDGAGAVVLGASEDARGIFGSALFTDGNLWPLLYAEGPLSLNPDLCPEEPSRSEIHMRGREVFKHAVRAMDEAITRLLAQHNMGLEEVNLVISHQANVRILHKLVERLGLPEEKFFMNVDKYGNTSAASIPIALHEANAQGRLTRNDIVLFCAFGGGFTWGSLLMRW